MTCPTEAKIIVDVSRQAADVEAQMSSAAAGVCCLAGSVALYWLKVAGAIEWLTQQLTGGAYVQPLRTEWRPCALPRQTTTPLVPG